MPSIIDPRLLLDVEHRPVLEWSPRTSARAELQAESGDLSAAADLVEHILSDDRVAGCLAQRTSVIRLPLEFTGGNEKFVKSLKEEANFWRICRAVEVKQLHKWHVLLGTALGRLNWVDKAGRLLRRGTNYTPRAVCWSPRNCSYAFATGSWSTYVGAQMQTELVVPGEAGWLLWNAADERPWAKGAWREIRAWCLLKDYARIDLARFSERIGQGILVLRVPPGSDTKSQRRELAQELNSLGSRASIALDSGAELDLVESQARNYDLFKMQIELANTAISIALLGQNLTTEVQSGALASTQVHKTVASEIIQADVEALSDFIHDQILVPVAIAQYGSPDAAPFPEYDATPLPDRDSTVKTWHGFGSFLKDVQATGIDKFLDVREAGERAGIPWRADAPEDLVLEPPPKPAPPPLPGLAPEEPDDGELEQEKPPTKDQGKTQAAELAVRLASGDSPSVSKGVVQGQLYTDRVVDSLGAEMARALRPTLQQVLGTIESPDTATIYDRLVDAFSDKMSAVQLGELLQGAMLIAGAAGIASAKIDQ